MKMKFRKPVLFLLLVTVLAPIVIYTDTLGAYISDSFSRNEFVDDASTFPFAGDVRPLNVLPQESSTTLKEPLGLIFSENSTGSSSNESNSSSAESTRITRQLTGESAEDQIKNSSTSSSSRVDQESLDENPIRQVTEGVETGEENLINIDSVEHFETGGAQNDVEKEYNSRHFEGTSDSLSNKMVA